MANHLLEFLNSNNTLYKFQFGFRKHFFTSHAIILVVERINKMIAYDKYMIGVFLDFRKAYYTGRFIRNQQKKNKKKTRLTRI